MADLCIGGFLRRNPKCREILRGLGHQLRLLTKQRLNYTKEKNSTFGDLEWQEVSEPHFLARFCCPSILSMIRILQWTKSVDCNNAV